MGSNNIYRFNFVHDYWTAFFNGFQYLQSENEAIVAVESLTVIQVNLNL